MNKLYTAKEISEILGISHSNVEYLRKNDIVKPESPGTGRGSLNRFSFLNIFEIALARKLADQSIQAKTIKFVIEQLSEWNKRTRGGLYLEPSQRPLNCTQYIELWRDENGDDAVFSAQRLKDDSANEPTTLSQSISDYGTVIVVNLDVILDDVSLAVAVWVSKA